MRPTLSADAFGLCRLRLGLVAALRKRCTRSYEGQPINRAAEGGSFVWIRTVASVTPFSRDGRESVVRSYRCRTPTCGGTKPAAGSALNGPSPTRSHLAPSNSDEWKRGRKSNGSVIGDVVHLRWQVPRTRHQRGRP